MKNRSANYQTTTLVNLLFISITILVSSWLLTSCATNNLPDAYVGHWSATNKKITVRTVTNGMKFEFTTDTASISLTLNQNNTASGTIGNAKFENATIIKNRGLPPSITGVAYIIKCGKIGKIFNEDPLDNKEVELWLSPITPDSLLNTELRYTSGLSVFPMAGFKLGRQ